ncbi:hypothetical protein FDUTEX481_09302 [Tolypothrix sp. PCC 7601]|nr:hypothetical protein FDUTEX481_09302 [Tolypothrix sp. PCC 7601]
MRHAIPLQSVAFFFQIGITQQKTDQSFWRGFGGRNRPKFCGRKPSPQTSPNRGFGGESPNSSGFFNQ